MRVASNNQTSPDIEDLPIPDSFIQKWAMFLAGGILFGAMLIYAINFHGPLSDQTSHWGEYGDFIGGLVNPIIGFFTIWLLATSLKQNQHALTQARRELELAREAIEQARDVQKATEEALTAQIQIAEKTRDFANAAVLFDAINKSVEQLSTEISRISTHKPSNKAILDQQRDTALKTKYKLANLLNAEANRLINKYPQSNDTQAE